MSDLFDTSKTNYFNTDCFFINGEGISEDVYKLFQDGNKEIERLRDALEEIKASSLCAQAIFIALEALQAKQ